MLADTFFSLANAGPSQMLAFLLSVIGYVGFLVWIGYLVRH